MPATPIPAAAPDRAATLPRLVPCLLLRNGRVCLPGTDGPRPVRTAGGGFLDPFDVVDQLTPKYRVLYVVDLDGIEHGDAQLDYLQELSRDMSLWVDAGVRRADQAIDVLVAGARRAVLSSAYLEGPRELKRAWRLSTEYLFEIEIAGGSVVGATDGWTVHDPYEMLRAVREVGLERFVVSPRGVDPDWNLIRTLTPLGPTWVDGSFALDDEPRLASAGAVGGIFHLTALLGQMASAAAPPPETPDAP
ncbi:MAG TPA: HisA/HisF-related TIM barrel protein [Thermoplasmata archaeon]|jgi:hypothetical protein|nr:HisA/HisF-related TIM barrel protein [Thermoplasmata archaeon]